MISSAVQLAALVNAPEFLKTVLAQGAAAGVLSDDVPSLTANASRWKGAILDVCHALGAEGDEEDFYRTLAAVWLELRFEWQRHNLVSNYGTVRHGCSAPLPLALAATSSALMAQLESLFDDSAPACLKDVAAQLIKSTHGLLSGEVMQDPDRDEHTLAGRSISRW